MRYQYFLPAVLWFLIILLIISMPGGAIPKTSLLKIPHFDKLVHGVLFFVFTILLNYGLFRQPVQTRSKRFRFFVAGIMGICYGLITELLQFCCIPGRSGEWMDLVANFTGILIGSVVFYMVLKSPLSKKFSLVEC